MPATSFVVSAIAVALAAVIACARRPATSVDIMTQSGWCASGPMKPLGRRSQVPQRLTHALFATVTGTVVRAETEDAIWGAVVVLSRRRDTIVQPERWTRTDSTGGFAFDSVSPGGYRLLGRYVGQYPDTMTIQLAAARVDTVRLRMRTDRCTGY